MADGSATPSVLRGAPSAAGTTAPFPGPIRSRAPSSPIPTPNSASEPGPLRRYASCPRRL